MQGILNYYPNYPTHRLYVGDVETPYSWDRNSCRELDWHSTLRRLDSALDNQETIFPQPQAMSLVPIQEMDLQQIVSSVHHPTLVSFITLKRPNFISNNSHHIKLQMIKNTLKTYFS